jgi:hypothetical protein
MAPCAATMDIVGRGRDRLMDVDFMKADQQNTFRGPYLIPTSTLELHATVAVVIGYPQPVSRKLVEECFSKTYKIKSDHELDKLHAKINYQFNGGKHKTVSPCYVYTHLKDSPAPEIPIVALHTGSTLPGNCGSPVIHCATGDLIGVHLGTSAVENYNLLITVHHPSFVYFYTHVLLPQWIELGIEGDYKARIKNYLKVHFASEHLNNQVLEYFGINIKKRKRKEDKGDRGEKQDNEKPPAKKPRTRVQPPRQKSAKELISSDEEASSPASPKENTTGSSSTNKYDDLLGPPSTPERTADSPLNIDYFMYE